MTSKQSTDKYCFLYSLSALTIGLTLGISLTYCILRETMIEKLKSPDPISEAEIRKTLFTYIQSNRVEELLKYLFSDIN